MLNFPSFFDQGVQSTLRLKPGVNWSHKGQWVQIFNDTEIDRWYVGDFSSASYQITVEYNSNKKEVLNALVVARPSEASIVVYGRISIDDELITLTATVNDSYLSLQASPTIATFDGAKLIFVATYAQTINDLTVPESLSYDTTQEETPGSGSIDSGPVTYIKKFKSDSGFRTTGFSVADGLLQVNNLDTDSFVTNSLEIGGESPVFSVIDGVATINSIAGIPGSINNINIGTITPASAVITNLSVTSSLVANTTGNISIIPSGTVTINPGLTGVIDNTIIGSTDPKAANFTTAFAISLSSTTGTITTLNSTTGTVTTLNSTTGNITDINSTTVTATNVTINNSLTVDNVTANEITINNAPSGPDKATRKDYVDATAAALAIALGA
jgi:hypothetical protein